MAIMIFIYPAVFRKEGDGRYHAFFPDLECCEASGDTLDDAIDNANDAAKTWIGVELEEDEPILPHVSDPEDIETQDAISSVIFLLIYGFTKGGTNSL